MNITMKTLKRNELQRLSLINSVMVLPEVWNWYGWDNILNLETKKEHLINQFSEVFSVS